MLKEWLHSVFVVLLFLGSGQGFAHENEARGTDLVLMVQELDERDILVCTVTEHLGKAFTEYLGETASISPQGRYNQGKLIFEMASAFFGVAEAKLLLKTGKLNLLHISNGKLPEKVMSAVNAKIFPRKGKGHRFQIAHLWPSSLVRLQLLGRYILQYFQYSFVNFIKVVHKDCFVVITIYCY